VSFIIFGRLLFVSLASESKAKSGGDLALSIFDGQLCDGQLTVMQPDKQLGPLLTAARVRAHCIPEKTHTAAAPNPATKSVIQNTGTVLGSTMSAGSIDTLVGYFFVRGAALCSASGGRVARGMVSGASFSSCSVNAGFMVNPSVVSSLITNIVVRYFTT
jgi:hypothetical protein